MWLVETCERNICFLKLWRLILAAKKRYRECTLITNKNDLFRQVVFVFGETQVRRLKEIRSVRAYITICIDEYLNIVQSASKLHNPQKHLEIRYTWCYNLFAYQVNGQGGVAVTELETMQRAKGYLDKLALGIDPLTGREVPEDSVLNNVRLARCFFYVSDLLERLIANGGQTEKKPKLHPFAMNAAQLARVQVSREPVRITQMVERISTAADNPQMRKLSTTVITNWLLEKGFLQKQTGMDGKSRRVPTREGFRIGLSIQTRQGQYGEYQAVYYNEEAQQFVLDNLEAMLERK